MKNWAVFLFISVMVAALVVTPQSGQAQTAVEPDTEAFISANFQLQESYNNVLCVAQNGDCPGEISVAGPCFVADCANAEQTYPVSETFEIIQDAAVSAGPGDLIIIMPGRYRGVQVEETGGEDGAYIHFLGWGDPGSVVVDGSADPEKSFLRHHFYFIDAHHYIIQNMAFEGAEDGAGIFFSGYFSNTGHFFPPCDCDRCVQPRQLRMGDAHHFHQLYADTGFGLHQFRRRARPVYFRVG